MMGYHFFSRPKLLNMKTMLLGLLGLLPVALKAKFWYSEDVNKNPIQLFVLLQLNISLINYCHQMPEAKWIEQKMRRSDDVLFTMMQFSAKKSEKPILLGEQKNLKA